MTAVTTAGTFRLHESVPSRTLKGGRNVIVYLPPGYEDNAVLRYPVLYLQDGQNLFDPATAFYHQDWGLSAIADRLIMSGIIEPLLIVGIYNAGERRLAEYSHVRDRQGQGGQARRYARFLAQELKPFIDAQYRTRPDTCHTGLGGSSMGGLVTLYIGLRYPGMFGKLIVMSPSIWWANRAILRDARGLRRKTLQKIWLDVGTAEGGRPEAVVQDARDLRDLLLAKGWQLGHDLRFVEDEGAGHNEKAWGCRMHDALAFLFPARPELASEQVDASVELHC